NPEKAGSVEVSNVRNFLSWTHQQPWMVLHELAHAYHHQVLGFDHAAVKDCYEAAVASKKYAEVLHVDGHRRRHYPLRNPQEYFAEAEEAFVGTNHFYRFVGAELKEHDPKAFALLEEVWETRKEKK